jgi:hypothetical protein
MAPAIIGDMLVPEVPCMWATNSIEDTSMENRIGNAHYGELST